MTWFRRHRRDLPWRETSDPYAVWVSEIMLQQTQVATVVPYYERFLQSFPSVMALAAATEQQVLQHWEGLGYYRRARQLHRAAQLVVERHGGQFPGELDAIQQLPGIGRYTAGAIASIAFGLPAPILEANTVRLYSRLLGFRGDLASTKGQQVLWRFAESLLQRNRNGSRNAGEINQALMELGSLVCTVRIPRCDQCPVSQFCRAFRTGQQETIPAPRSKPRIEAVLEAAVAVWRGKKVLLRQRPAGERWAGLWDFVRFPITGGPASATKQELIAKVRKISGLAIAPGRRLAVIRHSVTRFRITLACYEAQACGGRLASHTARFQWLTPAELGDLPLSVTGRKLARLLIDSPGRTSVRVLRRGSQRR